MLWAVQQASIPFSLPELPHLNEEEKALYKQQVGVMVVFGTMRTIRPSRGRLDLMKCATLLVLYHLQVYERETSRAGATLL